MRVLKEKLTRIFSNPNRPKIISAAIVLLLAVFYGSFLTHKINLVTADLGRHLKNGEYFFQNHRPPATNLYSYTEPDFPTINHHWGAGVIFYLLEQVGGLTLVHLFFIALSLISFFLFFMLAVKRSNLATAALVAIPIVPLLAERTEIRPEMFTYLFAGIFYFILWQYREGKLRWQWLLVLPVLEVLWVNTHIYFFLGPIIIGAFLMKWPINRRAAIVFIPTVLATLINPYGLKAVVEPFTILREYGYRIVENQPVWFIEKLIRNPNFLIFKIVFAMLVAGFIYAIWKNRRSFNLTDLILGILFSAMAWLQIRNFTIFGLFALPIVAGNIGARTKLLKFDLAVLLIIFVITISGNLDRFFPYWREFGVGLEKDNDAAANFFKARDLKGPIFNNYDIGSYLIYHLYPQEKVFVDNRPEAYSTAFFKNLYVPMQESEERWREADERFGFQAIIFSYHDATPWGQNFLVNRSRDPQWQAAFADGNVVIFLKKKIAL